MVRKKDDKDGFSFKYGNPVESFDELFCYASKISAKESKNQKFINRNFFSANKVCNIFNHDKSLATAC